VSSGCGSESPKTEKKKRIKEWQGRMRLKGGEARNRWWGAEPVLEHCKAGGTSPNRGDGPILQEKKVIGDSVHYTIKVADLMRGVAGRL